MATEEMNIDRKKQKNSCNENENQEETVLKTDSQSETTPDMTPVDQSKLGADENIDLVYYDASNDTNQDQSEINAGSTTDSAASYDHPDSNTLGDTNSKHKRQVMSAEKVGADDEDKDDSENDGDNEENEDQVDEQSVNQEETNGAVNNGLHELSLEDEVANTVQEYIEEWIPADINEWPAEIRELGYLFFVTLPPDTPPTID